MSTPIQRTFAGGELSPALQARVDSVKYQTGLKTMRNTIVMGEGGAANRPGFEYISTVPYTTKKVRLVEFEFNDEQTYILEFGHHYMRVIRNGNYATTFSTPISSITKANPGVVTTGVHGLSNGSIVFLVLVDGMAEVNSQYFIVANVTASTFTLKDFDGNDIDTTTYTTFIPGFALATIDFMITTPYDENDLDRLQFAQSADVLTIVHPGYPPYELSRYSDYYWTLLKAEYPDFSNVPPASVSGTATNVGTYKENYRVTGYNRKTGRESLPGLSAGQNILSISKANPGVVTLVSGSAEEGVQYALNVTGMTEVDDRRFIARNITGATFQLFDLNGNPVDTTLFGTFGVGAAYKTHVTVLTTYPITNANFVTVNWIGGPDYSEYRIYKYYLTGWFLIGTINGLGWRDFGITPDISAPAPEYSELFKKPGEYPSVVSYIQQSLVLASTLKEPEILMKSKIGDYHEFTPRFPVQSDDPTIFTMSGNKVNQIRHVVDLAKMIIFTSSGEWTAEGNDGVVTPSSINLKQYSRYGASRIRPLVIDGNAIFVQARGSIIRDLTFEWESQGYKGNDLTKFARHLFKGHTVVDWAYQLNPDSIVWVVREDGALLGLTYVREHQIWGWHRHDTDGLVKNVAVVTEGEDDAVYVSVLRTINGVERLYIERLANRYFKDIREAKFMDSFVTYDGRNPETSLTLTLSGSGWTPTDTLTLTASSGRFQASDVGNEIHFLDADGITDLRFQILSFTSGTVLTGKPLTVVPARLRSAATSVWALAVDQVLGLHHLEGKQVSAVGDGFVLASPNNDLYTVKTVTAGSVTFDECFAVIHVGLPYVSDIETLEIDVGSNATYTSQKKTSSQLDVRVHESRGIWFGSKLPDDDSTEGMYEYKQRYVEDGVVADLISETIETNIAGKWTKAGSIAIRQVDPLPLQVLSISPSVMIEEGKA